MRKKPVRAIILLVCVIAVAIAVWFYVSHRADPVSEDSTERSRSERAGKLTLEDQTPPVNQPETDLPEETSETSSGSVSDSEKTAANPYNFKTWEDAWNEYARLVGLEYDAAIKAGAPPELIEQHLEAAESAGDIAVDIVTPEKITQMWAIVTAAANARQKVFVNNEMPALKAAIWPFLDDIPAQEWLQMNLLVRAGRLPASVLEWNVTLPNGEVYDLKANPNTELIVRYKTRTQLSEDGRRWLKEAVQKENALLERLSKGDFSQSDESSLLAELEKVQKRLTQLRAPHYADHERRYSTAPPDASDAKVIIRDLGVIGNDD